jgi:DNA-binding NarL/FixJ family response regulator
LRRVALQIDDPDLLGRIIATLAREPSRVALVSREPDVVISDHLAVCDEAPTLVLDEPSNALEILKAGASGVLPRHSSISDLLVAIDAVIQGFAILPRNGPDPELPDSTPPKPSGFERDHMLTARELEVLRLLAEGASNKLIARRLGISFHTAKFHVASIATKLDATGRTDAVAQAARLGLILL